MRQLALVILAEYSVVLFANEDLASMIHQWVQTYNRAK